MTKARRASKETIFGNYGIPNLELTINLVISVPVASRACGKDEKCPSARTELLNSPDLILYQTN